MPLHDVESLRREVVELLRTAVRPPRTAFPGGVLITEGDLAGLVAFVDQPDLGEVTMVVATDLWRFMRFLLLSDRGDRGDRGWPFDPGAVLAADPAMAGVAEYLLPWSTRDV